MSSKSTRKKWREIEERSIAHNLELRKAKEKASSGGETDRSRNEPRRVAKEESGFRWINENKFPGHPGRETREAIFYLSSLPSLLDSSPGLIDVFLVNNTKDTLPFVKAEAGGFETCDEDVITMKAPSFEYRDILPGEAVKVLDYDDYHDSDWMMQLSIELSSPTHSELEFRLSGKNTGGFIGALLWEDGKKASQVDSLKKNDAG